MTDEPDVHGAVVESDYGDAGLHPAHEYDLEPSWSAHAVHEEADADPEDPFVLADAAEGDPDAYVRRQRLRREMRARGVL